MADQQLQGIVPLFQSAVNQIMMQFQDVDDLLNDDKRRELMQGILGTLEQVGLNLADVVGPELAKAYHDSMQTVDAFLMAGKDKTDIQGFSRKPHLDAIEKLADDTMDDLQATIRTAGMMMISDIDGILAGVREEVAKGLILGEPSTWAKQRLMEHYNKHGLTGFLTKEDTRGVRRRIPIDVYSELVARTKYRDAQTQGIVNRCVQGKVYHVKISEQHPTCKQCARYQGKVVALDEDHADGFPTDIPLPPYHPNCRHVIRPFVLSGHSQTDIKKERQIARKDRGDDGRTSAEQDAYKQEQKIKRVANQEKKGYEKMKAVLGPDAPKNIGAYRRMKRKGDASWQKLQADYKRAQDNLDAQGPSGYATPRKKKGSKPGGSPPSAPKPKKKSSTTTKQTGTAPPKPKVNAPQTPPATPKAPPPTPSGPKLDRADQRAHQRFDSFIDGIDLTDRRRAMKHILDKNPKTAHLNPSIKKGKANGYVQSGINHTGEIVALEYVLRSNDFRSHPHQLKTMFHEYYHANMHGLDQKKDRFSNVTIGGSKTWTAIEETATECSAVFMSNRAGNNMTGKALSYSNYLTENLPRLIQMDEFQDCTMVEDFGAKFMKYRFEMTQATADWTEFRSRMMNESKSVKFLDYVNKHYKQWIIDNQDMVMNEVLDILQQDKTGQETAIKNHLWREVEKGFKGGNDHWLQVAVTVAFNTIGVKKP